jgi:hypothetical protein
MEFRADHSDPIGTLVTFNEFCDMIRAGTVEPTALFRARFRGEWRPVVELPVFRRLSPTHRGGRRTKEADGLKLWDYRFSFVQRETTLFPLEHFARQSDAQIAVRLFISLALVKPEGVVSIAFRRNELIVWGLNAGIFLLLFSVGRPAPAVLDRSAWVRRTVPLDLAPFPMRSAAEYSSALSNCPSVYSPQVFDGVSFRHEYFDGQNRGDLFWGNPNPRIHAAHYEMLDGYLALLTDSKWVSPTMCNGTAT